MPEIPAAGMFVQMMQYSHPVAFSKAVKFFACRQEGFRAPDDPAQAFWPPVGAPVLGIAQEPAESIRS
jgi:hypothetical protein